MWGLEKGLGRQAGRQAGVGRCRQADGLGQGQAGRYMAGHCWVKKGADSREGRFSREGGDNSPL